MNCRLMVALGLLLAAAAPFRAPLGLSLAIKAGAFAFTLCTGGAACR